MNAPPSIDNLRAILSHTLSPDATLRKAAENQLTQAKASSAHPLQILKFVASNEAVDAPVRQSAAIHFKNIIKNGWVADEDGGTNGINISPSDRELIKTHLVELMCTVPHQIQAQCSECISLIADVDFPQKWVNLLPGLVQKFSSKDPSVIQGVLLTANSICKRFRYVQKSDALYTDLAYVLGIIQAPLLTLLKTIGQAVDGLQNDVNALKPMFACLRLICRIFYSLNYQDLPEYFEDHMKEWMEQFSKYLSYENPLLTDADEEYDPSPIDKLQEAVVAGLNLYACKDEEPFLPFLPNFTTLVWNLLLKISSYSKHDALAASGIKFLASLVTKQMHKSLFQEESTLREIISKIVVPNLMIREVDEERFEDDAEEFILSDMEGSETDSRRKCSQELLRAMCRQFETETTTICMEQIGTMLKEFNSDRASKWAAKDVAIHLMLGISIRAETATHGVSSVNDKVNVMEFFSSQILPELQDSNHSSRPMVKATAIKFVSIFRNQFSKEHLCALIPIMIAYLPSLSVVIHSYSAAAIEKILTTKKEINGVKKAVMGTAEIQLFLEPLFTGLFGIVDNEQLNENEYAMKCVMRSLAVTKKDIIPVTQTVLEKLTKALERVAKNPRDPQYNHYLFESIAVLVKSVCSEDPAYTTAFEGLLFPPFQIVLQADVAEFTPYVFQVLAQLLEYRPINSGLGPAYSALFAPLLTPVLWDRKGNIPALSRLLRAYCEKGGAEICAGNNLPGVLGIFQKLVASRANEMSAFDLLDSIVLNIPPESISPHMNGLVQILLLRLQKGKTVRFTRLLTRFFAVYLGTFGSNAFLQQLDAVQPGLGLMLLGQVWIPRLMSDVPVRMEAKIQIAALTKLICSTPAMVAAQGGDQLWAQCMCIAVKIMISPNSLLAAAEGTDDDDFEMDVSYDATYSKLHFANRPAFDPFPEMKDPVITLLQSLQQLCASQPGKFSTLIKIAMQSDVKLSTGFDSLINKAGVSLV